MLKLSFHNVFYLVLYAMPNTFLSLGILYIINSVIASKNQFQPDYMRLVFVAIVVYTYLLNIIFQTILNKYSFLILYGNEKKMFERILSIPLPVLEKCGCTSLLKSFLIPNGDNGRALLLPMEHAAGQSQRLE